MRALFVTGLVLSVLVLPASKREKTPAPPPAWDKVGITLDKHSDYLGYLQKRPVPDRNEMCLSITSYWVWDEGGQILDGWQNQCNEDCSITASGTRLPLHASEYSGGYAACIQDWTSLVGYPTRVLDVPGYGHYTCVDTFGDLDYRQPFFHEGYDRWVIPVDLLHPGAQDLVCDWSGSWEVQ
jgi:hypothetical protein